MAHRLRSKQAVRTAGLAHLDRLVPTAAKFAGVAVGHPSGTQIYSRHMGIHGADNAGAPSEMCMRGAEEEASQAANRGTKGGNLQGKSGGKLGGGQLGG